MVRTNWPELLPLCAMYYNTSRSNALNMSPSEARFGFAITFPLQIRKIGRGEESEPLLRLRERQKSLLQCAKDTLGNYKDLMITGAASQRTRTLSVGDSVMVDAKVLLPTTLHVVNRKTNQRFLGPYKGLEEISPGFAYKIQLPLKSRAHPVFNIGYLKKILITEEFDGRPVYEDDPQEKLMDYVVESIVSHKMIRRIPYFLVKWESYGEEFNTWESDVSFRQDDGSITNVILLEYLRAKKIRLE